MDRRKGTRENTKINKRKELYEELGSITEIQLGDELLSKRTTNEDKMKN